MAPPPTTASTRSLTRSLQARRLRLAFRAKLVRQRRAKMLLGRAKQVSPHRSVELPLVLRTSTLRSEDWSSPGSPDSVRRSQASSGGERRQVDGGDEIGRASCRERV